MGLGVSQGSVLGPLQIWADGWKIRSHTNIHITQTSQPTKLPDILPGLKEKMPAILKQRAKWSKEGCGDEFIEKVP